MTLAISIITGTISRVSESAMSGRRSPSLENCGLLVHCFELGQQTRQIRRAQRHDSAVAPEGGRTKLATPLGRADEELIDHPTVIEVTHVAPGATPNYWSERSGASIAARSWA